MNRYKFENPMLNTPQDLVSFHRLTQENSMSLTGWGTFSTCFQPKEPCHREQLSYLLDAKILGLNNNIKEKSHSTKKNK